MNQTKKINLFRTALNAINSPSKEMNTPQNMIKRMSEFVFGEHTQEQIFLKKVMDEVYESNESKININLIENYLKSYSSFDNTSNFTLAKVLLFINEVKASESGK